MNKLPKDVVELITNKLTPRDFINYCKSERGQEFCSKKEIWLKRIQKDFGFLLEGKNKDFLLSNYQIDPKQAYLNLFISTSSATEEITSNILLLIGNDFLKLLKDSYEENLYNFFFQYMLKMINRIILPQEEDEEFDISTVTNDYFWDHSGWDKYLPLRYHLDLFDTLNREMSDVLSKYAVAIFLPQKYKN